MEIKGEPKRKQEGDKTKRKKHLRSERVREGWKEGRRDAERERRRRERNI